MRQSGEYPSSCCCAPFVPRLPPNCRLHSHSHSTQKQTSSSASAAALSVLRPHHHPHPSSAPPPRYPPPHPPRSSTRLPQTDHSFTPVYGGSLRRSSARPDHPDINQVGHCYGCRNNGYAGMKHPNNDAYSGGNLDGYLPFGVNSYVHNDDEELSIKDEEDMLRRMYKGGLNRPIPKFASRIGVEN